MHFNYLLFVLDYLLQLSCYVWCSLIQNKAILTLAFFFHIPSQLFLSILINLPSSLLSFFTVLISFLIHPLISHPSPSLTSHPSPLIDFSSHFSSHPWRHVKKIKKERETAKLTFATFKWVSCFFFRYVVCKGLRENSQAVHEFMFNVNVRINKLKKEDILDVVEVGGEFLTWVFLRWWQYKALYLKCGVEWMNLIMAFYGCLSSSEWSSSFIKYLS